MNQGIQESTRSEEQRPLAVYGIYSDCSSAVAAIDALREAAIAEADFSLLLRPERPPQEGAKRDPSKPPQKSACAARLGDPEPVNVPEVGEVLASGPIKTTLTSSSNERGRSCMRLPDALAAVGFPPYQVPLYENAVLENRVLAIIACGDFEAAERAVDLLEGTGAYEIGALRR